jgi:hypothetical protein
MRTRLDHFNEAEQCSLINWGYTVCDAAMRTYVVPSDVTQQAPAWPYPTYRLDQALSNDVATDETNDLVDVRSMPQTG